MGPGKLRDAGRLLDRGRSIPREIWDRQYREGAWESLDSIDELDHYLVIAGYIRGLFASPTVLDVGCGPGRLGELLEGVACRSYLGIDLSPEAIKRARQRRMRRAKFRVADLDVWTPPGRFSVIVFCESLNYATHPAFTLMRYTHALEPDGALIVSLYRHANHGCIWRQAARAFAILEAATVSNRREQTWDVKVLRPRSNRRPAPHGRNGGSGYGAVGF